MNLVRQVRLQGWLAAVAVTVALLAAATLLIAALEEGVGVPNASTVYLIAVVGAAIAFGTVPSVLTAVASFLLYDFLFTEPLHTLAVANPGEWLNLVLLLLVAIVVGQLGAVERNRAESAELRAREARVLFQVSRALATRETTGASLAAIVEILAHESGMSRVWVELGPETAPRRVVADSAPGDTVAHPATHMVLARSPGDIPANWIRIHQPTARTRREAGPSGELAYRVNIEVARRTLGTLWGLRSAATAAPSREETRMLAAAADQIGQALEQDRLRVEATSAELARRSDALKTALLDSVSHDLRTPLAAIRAAAGGLMDPVVEWPAEERRAAAAAIDREAERLNRLVTNLLDLSRIEAGELVTLPEAFPVEDLVSTSLRRLAPQLDGRQIEVAIPPDLPLVDVDATFMDQILSNLIDNALAYVPAGAAIRITAEQSGVSSVRLIVEDGGPGVPDSAIGSLFDKFFRVATPSNRASRGTGLGLAVVRGFVEAMGGRIGARRSALGGLAVEVDLPVRARPIEAGEGESAVVTSQP
jgi:two-component system, OmpR family, sensor histidine kinase KdpD